MKKRIVRMISLLLSLIMVLGMLPAGLAAQPQAAGSAETEEFDGTVRVDFMEFAQAAAQQPWWDALNATNLNGVKVLGVRNSSTVETAEELQAQEQMHTWLAENANWSRYCLFYCSKMAQRRFARTLHYS